MSAFYWAIECPHCDETSHHGINVTALSHKELPVIPIDMGTTASYTCEHCGAEIVVGELDVWSLDNFGDVTTVDPTMSP